ncbi:MAG: diguanylate cyclase, partial [Burkholderiales bacterium]
SRRVSTYRCVRFCGATSDIVDSMPVTASLGLACGSNPVDPGDLLRAADQCLYQAKRAGRDRVVGISLG